MSPHNHDLETTDVMLGIQQKPKKHVGPAAEVGRIYAIDGYATAANKAILEGQWMQGRLLPDDLILCIAKHAKGYVYVVLQHRDGEVMVIQPEGRKLLHDNDWDTPTTFISHPIGQRAAYQPTASQLHRLALGEAVTVQGVL